jgi:hypothetical protein
MPPKVMSGARAKVAIVDPNTGKAQVVGIWNNFSYSVNYDVQPAFILGRYSAAELDTTGVEPVSITAGGWRVVNHGPFVDGKLTNVKDLLLQEYLVLTVVDRQTGAQIATIKGCLPTGFSSGLSARQLQETTNTYMGLLMDDESTTNTETSSAANLP